ncbi:TIGR03086 family protein [Actinobacteria bacterium YIM 96077]|uniref:TIGR03086 family protein n=1 Tax=Phytoactinopolyspora halophila TaxID=1981511 RepID=A0A329QQ66_9ACTN|nr:TIGR03086 family metal-binding protein [Phytoactinopolyspora halophila]AYY14571.1 TIGR03086 family protein [Actinobacteria bacterium YIM 96077]RAW14051.1 TIGR03086 family protein [Phytoactinopolyspora halophila]
MTSHTAVTEGVALLERAMSYALGVLSRVGPEHMGSSTPCRSWDLRDLLLHVDDSLAALGEAVDGGATNATGGKAGAVATPGGTVTAVRERACTLLGTLSAPERSTYAVVGDQPVSSGLVAVTGAVEVAVHGWDVARTCGVDHPVPVALSEELCEFVPSLVSRADRVTRFAPPVELPPGADPCARLVAFLGRNPSWPDRARR